MPSTVLTGAEIAAALGSTAIAGNAATATKLLTTSMAQSGTLTGTGSAQTWSHGLGATPRMFWWEMISLPLNTLPDVSYGTVDATGITITVPLGLTYRMHAIL